MSYVLNIAYLIAAVSVMPVLIWRALFTGKYRSGWRAKLFGQVPIREGDAPCIWMHAVSVGEVNLLPKIVEQLQREHSEFQIAISTTTATGFELAKKRFPSLPVFYCPLDFSWSVKRAMRRIRPAMLVLAELEIWPNLIAAARSRNVEVAVINARLSDTTFHGYRRLARVLRPTFGRLSLVLAQNETYAQRFRELGSEQVVVTGSIKFDGATTRRDSPQVIAAKQLIGVDDSHMVWIAGSTQDPEEQYALDIYQHLRHQHSQLRLVIVPRHPERFDAVAKQVEQEGLSVRRRSGIHQPVVHWHADTILLLDTIGELGDFWGLADIAYVGGSMGCARGGQNMIEPAAYGASVCFGPNTKNFRDIVSLFCVAQAAQVVNDPDELEAYVEQCLTGETGRLQGERARQLVIDNQGAVQETMQRLIAQMPIATDPRRSAAA